MTGENEEPKNREEALKKNQKSMRWSKHYFPMNKYSIFVGLLMLVFFLLSLIFPIMWHYICPILIIIFLVVFIISAITSDK